MRIRSLLSLPVAIGLAAVNAQEAPFAQPDTRPVATVNGRIINRHELEVATQYALMRSMQSPQPLTESKAPGTQQGDARRDAHRRLIDRELVISEFEGRGVHIKPEDIEEDIQRLIREHFNGSRDTFVQELVRKGSTLTRFREDHLETRIVAAVREEVPSHAGNSLSWRAGSGPRARWGGN